MLITITYNQCYQKEKEYIINSLFKEFLGLNIKHEIKNTKHYEININNTKVIIEDHFFNKAENQKTYLKQQYLPKVVQEIKNPLNFKGSLISLYGENKVYQNNNLITCGIDIFASAYFMLTRWEEYVIKEKDEHNRFDHKKACSVKNNFIHRPIVNEYVEFLWTIIKNIEPKSQRIKRNFQYHISHDIDDLSLWKTPYHFIKSLIKYTFKYPTPKFLLKSLYNYPYSFINKKFDPWYCFDYFMDLSESLNTKSIFYFMTGGTSKLDNRYHYKSTLLKKTLHHINNRGHIIGLHPSYNSYNDINLLKKEIDRLNQISPQKTIYSRQHYLRYSTPSTLHLLDKLEIKNDSTDGYSKLIGFRSGCCYTYPTFNFIEQKKLAITNTPLHVMDTSIFSHYKNLDFQNLSKKVNSLKQHCKKHNGIFSFLWHNSNNNIPEWIPYQKHFLNYLK